MNKNILLSSGSRSGRLWPRRVVSSAALLSLALTSAAVAYSFARPGSHDVRQYIHGDSVLPSSAVQDWVDYSDAVVVIKVTGERKTELSEEEKANREGLRIRIIDADVTKVVWDGPSEVVLPKAVSFPHGGWLVHEGSVDERYYLENAADLKVGHSYLMPLVKVANDVAPWQALAPDTILPADSGVVGSGETVLTESGKALDWRNGTSAVKALLKDKTVAAAGTILDGVHLSALAAKNINLPAVDRYHKALDEQGIR